MQHNIDNTKQSKWGQQSQAERETPTTQKTPNSPSTQRAVAQQCARAQQHKNAHTTLLRTRRTSKHSANGTSSAQTRSDSLTATHLSLRTRTPITAQKHTKPNNTPSPCQHGCEAGSATEPHAWRAVESDARWSRALTRLPLLSPQPRARCE
jgi:hypothetical protein